jgi:hypothetical protein
LFCDKINHLKSIFVFTLLKLGLNKAWGKQIIHRVQHFPYSSFNYALILFLGGCS